MHIHPFVSADEIRSRFSAAMSEMYRQEVPPHGTRVDLVVGVNARELAANSSLLRQFVEGSDQGMLYELAQSRSLIEVRQQLGGVERP